MCSIYIYTTPGASAAVIECMHIRGKMKAVFGIALALLLIAHLTDAGEGGTQDNLPCKYCVTGCSNPNADDCLAECGVGGIPIDCVDCLIVADCDSCAALCQDNMAAKEPKNNRVLAQLLQAYLQWKRSY